MKKINNIIISICLVLTVIQKILFVDPRARREPSFAQKSTKPAPAAAAPSPLAPKPQTVNKFQAVQRGPVLEWFQLPHQYKRKDIDDKEVEYINVSSHMSPKHKL